MKTDKESSSLPEQLKTKQSSATVFGCRKFTGYLVYKELFEVCVCIFKFHGSFMDIQGLSMLYIIWSWLYTAFGPTWTHIKGVKKNKNTLRPISARFALFEEFV